MSDDALTYEALMDAEIQRCGRLHEEVRSPVVVAAGVARSIVVHADITTTNLRADVKELTESLNACRAANEDGTATIDHLRSLLRSLLRDALPYVENGAKLNPLSSSGKTLAADIRQALGEDDE